MQQSKIPPGDIGVFQDKFLTMQAGLTRQ